MLEDAAMPSTNRDDWSPADNPYAIAVSQSQMWRDVVRLTVLRMRDEDDRRTGWFSSRQLDAHTLVVALRQLLIAEELEQAALEELGMEPVVGTALAEARKHFEDTLPGIKHMRDALMHFDEWARGRGRGPQRDRVKAGAALRDVAREFWHFGYDSTSGTVTFGPYIVNVGVAERAAAALCKAISVAAREVDAKNTAELRAKVIRVLAGAGLRCNNSDAAFRVSSGNDLRIWVSLDVHYGRMESGRRELSERIVNALEPAGLHLETTNQAVELNSVERLVLGEVLWVGTEM